MLLQIIQNVICLTIACCVIKVYEKDKLHCIWGIVNALNTMQFVAASKPLRFPDFPWHSRIMDPITSVPNLERRGNMVTVDIQHP
ncbi:hypothetical protein P5V15_002272 [Pogonomyrmex californicus]